jgi:hypothetical protein
MRPHERNPNPPREREVRELRQALAQLLQCRRQHLVVIRKRQLRARLQLCKGHPLHTLQAQVAQRLRSLHVQCVVRGAVR